MQEAGRDLKVEPELPALFDDLELGDALDAALPTLDGPDGGPPSPPPILGLDLRDLPAPVGPRPRSPLSTAGRAPSERRRPASSPALVMPAAVATARGPAPKPPGSLDAEPAPLPAPPARGQSGELKVFVPGAAPAPAAPESKPAARPSSPLPRPPAGPVQPPAGKRVSAPGIVVPSLRELAARETQPGPRRISQPGIPVQSKPVHALFDASDAAPPAPVVPPLAAGRPAEPTPVPLPPLPSDESGNARPTPTPVATGSSSDASETSVLSGQPAASSVATVEPRPVRLGYLIAGLAVLALLLAFIIGHIAGLWPKPPPTHLDKPAAVGSSPESPPPSF